jgi:hypothetical protein
VLIGKGGVWGNVIRTGMMLNSTKEHVDILAMRSTRGLTAAAKDVRGNHVCFDQKRPHYHGGG